MMRRMTADDARPPQNEKAQRLAVLRIRNFRFLLLTRMCVGMALQAQAVIVGWQVWSLTKDPFLLGLTGLVEALPALSGALVAGYVIDISPPRTAYLACIVALALNTFALLAVAGGHAGLSDSALVLFIFGGVFFSGLARCFVMPAGFSLLTRTVPRAEIPAATAWLSSAMQTAHVVGPALAGLLYGGYGASGAWMLPFFFILVAVAGAALLQVAPSPLARGPRQNAWESIKAGWHFILRTPVLLSLMSLDMIAVLFGGATVLLPVFAEEVLHVGSEGLGALRAAPALGGVATALLLAVRPMRHISATRMLLAVAGFGACMIGFGLSTSFYLSMGLLLLSGIFDSISMLVRGTLMQLLTPDDMRGRVSAINSMFIISSNEIGAFESGTAARLLGLVPSVVFGGMMTLLVTGGLALFSPKLRKTIVDVKKESA